MGEGRRLAQEQGRPVVLGWITAAERALALLDDVALAALRTNFALPRVVGTGDYLSRIASTYRAARRVIVDERRYAEAPEEDVKRFFGTAVPPAYTTGGVMYFTSELKKFGPMCRAAMLLHESIHVVDARSGEPAIHIAEWDERFGAMTAEQQVHNPSAYASFAAQVFERRTEWPREARYGAGSPSV
jgi:hypothetical protein